MTPSTLPQHDLEAHTQQLGELLLQEAERHAQQNSLGQRIEQGLFSLLGDPALRIQALRFVDVLPTLESDQQLLEHFRLYFSPVAKQLPNLLQRLLNRDGKHLGDHLLAATIRQTVKQLGHHFIAGESINDALQETHKQWRQGFSFSLDLLGEAALSNAECDHYQNHYLAMIEQLANTSGAWRHSEQEPIAHLSLKPSSLDSQLNASDYAGSQQRLAERLRPIFRTAQQHNVAILLDMEQYDLKRIYLTTFKQLLMEAEFRHWDGAGIALQAYLRDTEADLLSLYEWAVERGSPVTVRLVRGAYWDQERITAQQQGWSLPVWRDKGATDLCYQHCCERLLAAYPHLKAAIATHNPRSLAYAMALNDHYGPGKEQFEFQMLYGMAPHLRHAVQKQGYKLRLYMPFGELIPGMAYLVRRLLENSSNDSLSRMLSAENAVDRAALAPPQRQSRPNPPRDEPFHNTPLYRFTDPADHLRVNNALRELEPQLGHEYRLKELRSQQWLDSYNPARPEQRVGRISAAGSMDAEQALQRAGDSLKGWSATPVAQRSGLLRRVAALLLEERDQFIAWQLFEVGKSRSEADAEVCEAIDFLRFYADAADQLFASPLPQRSGEENRRHYQPRGVGVILPPWNFPLAILTGMLSAAIVCGNTAVLKPSSQSPIIAYQLYLRLLRAGLPQGVVNFLPGAGATIGQQLVQDRRCQFVAFTGSREVGLHLNQLAAESSFESGHIKHVIAEMGGKNAIIVDEDADLDDAIRGVIHSAFDFQGQKCSACSRVIVVGRHYELFKQRLVEAARSLSIGPPSDSSQIMGPLISADSKQRLLKAIEAAKQHYRPLLEVKHPGPGHYLGPVIFADTGPDDPILREELFGPVLTLFHTDSFSEALALANRSAYALTGGVYSRHPRHLAMAEQQFQVGNLYLNRKITGALVSRQPFGGFKLSGMGGKAGEENYLLQFVDSRCVSENSVRRGFAPEV